MLTTLYGENFELRLYDRSFEAQLIVESYESLIWTERYNQSGDFQLKLPVDGASIDRFRPGRYLMLSVSDEIMIIESIKTAFQSDGTEILEVAGKTFDSILQERVVTTRRKFNGAPGWIATEIFREICERADGLSPNDRIPNVWSAAQAPSTIQVEADIRSKSLYTAIKDLCDSDDLGFRIYYNPDRWDGNFLVFVVFRGTDRTSAVTHASGGPEAVVFSRDLNNLNAAAHIRSHENYKTVAYVWHDDRTNPLIVTPRNKNANSGMSRRVLSVDANDIEAPTTEELRQRGREELSHHKYKELVDGEADYVRAFRYKRDYNLGDLVEVWYPNEDKVKSRVTEHIWSFDSTGLKAYPTLEYVEHL